MHGSGWIWLMRRLEILGPFHAIKKPKIMKNGLRDCLYASFRDINSCRPTTNNVLNGLSVDVFIAPRSHECGINDFQNAIALSRATDEFSFHGWRLPVPDVHKVLQNPRFDRFGKPLTTCKFQRINRSQRWQTN